VYQFLLADKIETKLRDCTCHLNSIKMVTCSHCLTIGHTKASPTCPLKGKESAIREPTEPLLVKWTPDMEERLVILVNEGPFETDWEEIGNTFKKTSSACKTRYYEIVSHEDDLISRNKRLNIKDIYNLVEENHVICEKCSCHQYIPLKIWKGMNLCHTCHALHKPEIDELWENINTYLTEIGMNNCKICNHVRVNGEDPFQFDHISMFNKNDSICSMVYRGESFESIKIEIQLCQIVCRSCHYIITRIESKLGFKRMKLNMTRIQNGTTKDIEVLSSEENKLQEEKMDTLYRKTMDGVYNKLKEFIHIRYSI